MSSVGATEALKSFGKALNAILRHCAKLLTYDQCEEMCGGLLRVDGMRIGAMTTRMIRMLLGPGVAGAIAHV